MVRCPIDVDGTIPGLIRRYFLEGRLGGVCGRSGGQEDRKDRLVFLMRGAILSGWTTSED
jgi:hypothetical protein